MGSNEIGGVLASASEFPRGEQIQKQTIDNAKGIPFVRRIFTEANRVCHEKRSTSRVKSPPHKLSVV